MSVIDVYIFRHGETDWNRQLRMQGHTDIPLNELGREQARKLAKLIETHRPEMIVTSDLDRAQETARIANEKLAAPVHITTSLRECSMGDLEGLHRDEAFKLHGSDAWDRWASTHPRDKDYGFPNGETKSQHLQRMLNFLEPFLRAHRSLKSVALSTHGGSLRRLLHHCEGSPQEAVMIPNCVMYKVSFHRDTGRWHFHGLVE